LIRPLRIDGRRFRVFDEVPGARGLQQLCREESRLAEMFGQRERLRDQIARVTAAERNAARAIEAFQQILNKRRIVADILSPVELQTSVGWFASDRVRCNDASAKVVWV
jgi:hypothetical protein